MDWVTELPMHVPTPAGMLTVADYNVKLEIAQDICGAGSWYVESVSVWGAYGTDNCKWHELSEDHAISRTCKRLAYSDWNDRIADKWSEHKFNNPPARMRTPFRVIGGGRDQ